MAQQHNSHGNPALLFSLAVLPAQRHAVLLLDVDVTIVRHNAQHRYLAELFQNGAPLVEEAQVATKLIDDDAFDEFSLFFWQEHDAAID